MSSTIQEASIARSCRLRQDIPPGTLHVVFYTYNTPQTTVSTAPATAVRRIAWKRNLSRGKATRAWRGHGWAHALGRADGSRPQAPRIAI